MFSAFSSFSLPLSVPRFLGRKNVQAITLESVEIHDIEIRQEKGARTLKHLLKLNHVNHAILFHNLEFHNHLPHLLGSAYLFGANSDHLNHLYEHESRHLDPWKDSPGEVSRHDWRDYLGDPRYERAFVDFFEDELVLNGYVWQKVVKDYLFTGANPLGHCLISGLGHPLIHLGYAFELCSREIAMEALGLAACSYDFLHKYLDDPAYTKPSSYSTTSPLEILQRVRRDRRLDGLFNEPGAANIRPLMEEHEDVVLEHLNAWHFSDPKKQFEDSQHAAAAVLVATYEAGGNAFDFFLMHTLSTSHAVRILLPLIPEEFHIALVRQWWLLTLIVYIAQLRPEIDLEYVINHDLEGKDWDWVGRKAIEGKWDVDAHYVKALRAFKEAANTWGDEENFYLKAAARFGNDFAGWSGFGAEGNREHQ